VTPRDRAMRMTAAEVRAIWSAAKPEHYSEDGIPCERALDENGAEVVAMFTDAMPTLWLAVEERKLVIVGEDDLGPVFVPVPEDCPMVREIRAAFDAVAAALVGAVEPKSVAAREAATKAVHSLGFALDDLRRASR
jgi:hypothetical protein